MRESCCKSAAAAEHFFLNLFSSRHKKTGTASAVPVKKRYIMYYSPAFSLAASIKPRKIGCARLGLDLNSG